MLKRAISVTLRQKIVYYRIMTIKKIATIGAIAATLLLAAQPAFAANMSKLKITLSDSINKDCLQPDGYDPVWGCFINNYLHWEGHQELMSQPTIYIRSNIPTQLLPYVLLSNFGEYLLGNYSDQEISAAFNPSPASLASAGIRTIASNAFVMWFYGGHVPAAAETLFKTALAK